MHMGLRTYMCAGLCVQAAQACAYMNAYISAYTYMDESTSTCAYMNAYILACAHTSA
jgi:hypothetical protein